MNRHPWTLASESFLSFVFTVWSIARSRSRRGTAGKDWLPYALPPHPVPWSCPYLQLILLLTTFTSDSASDDVPLIATTTIQDPARSSTELL